MTTPTGAARDRRIDDLERALNTLVNEQFESPEFRLLAQTPLTIDRARFYTKQMVFYTLNRRDCWAYVQARAPLDVKQAIWTHEQDELISDSRAGTDHVTLMNREAAALGVSEDELRSAEPAPALYGTLLGLLYLASTLPWLAGLTASHFLERRNNNALLTSGAGSSVRWRDRLVNELHIDPAILQSSNVHSVADEEHSDLIWDSIARHVVDERSRDDVLLGAREAAKLDRAVRFALATGMRQLSKP
jgi:hypothetical protein